MASNTQSHHHQRRHRRHPHPVACPRTCRSPPTRSPTPPSAPPRPGAAIVHMHARDPQRRPAVPGPRSTSTRSWPSSKRNTDAVINITTGGSPHMTVEERMQPAAAVQARTRLTEHGFDELRPLPDAGALQGIRPRLGARRHWRRAATWSSRTPSPTSRRILEIGNGNGTRFEFECYDISHLNNLAHFHGRGLARGPLFVQSVFGLLGGIGAPPRRPDAHAPHRRPAPRRGLRVVDPGRREEPDAAGHHRRRHGLPRPGRPGGLAVDRTRPAGRVQRRAGHPDPHHPRSPQLRGRHPR